MAEKETRSGRLDDLRQRAEAAPDEAERFARAVLDALSAHIAILDQTGVIIAVNRAWRSFAQANQAPLSSVCEGANYLAVCDAARGADAEQAAAFAAALRAVMRGEQNEFSLEYPCHSPDQQRWFNVRATCFSSNGAVRVVVAHEDIAQRKQAEEGLRRSETKFRTLYDSTSDAVMLCDEKGFFDCNPATLAMFGCATREEFCSKHPANVSPPVQPDGTDSLTLASQRIGTALEKGSHYFEWMHKRADNGETFPADVLLSALELDGKPVLQAVVRNITKRKQAEEALHRTQTELKVIYENAPTMMCVLDASWRVLYANRAFAEFVGRPMEEMRLERACGVIGCLRALDDPRGCGYGPHCETCAVRLAMVDALATGRSRRAIEYRTTALCHGQPRDSVFLASVAPIQLTGQANLLLCLEDITEREQAQEALRESEEQFRAIANYTADWENWFGPDGKLLWVNPAAERMTGYSVAECLAMPGFPRPLLAEEDRAAVSALFQEAVGGSHGNDREFRFLHKDGNKQWGAVSWQPIFASDGTALGHRSSVRDINRRKLAEEALRASEQRYRTVVEDQTEVISRHQKDGTFTFVNEVYCRFFGKTCQELLGSKWQPQAVTEDLPLIEQKLRTLSPANPSVLIENRVYSGTGEVRWMQCINRSFFDAAGRLVETQVVGRDITERKQADAMLRIERDLALALSNSSQLQEGMRLCLEAALTISGMECGGFYLVDKISGALDLAFHKDLSSDFVKAAAHYAADSANAKLVMAGKPVYAEHTALGVPLSDARRRENLRAIAVVPVSHEGQVIGCLNVASHALGVVPAFARDALETVVAQTGNAIARLQAEEALRQLSGRFLQLQDEERRRVARELHDTVAQGLAALSLNLGLLRSRATALNPRSKKLLADSQALADQCANEVRSSSYLLHPPILDELGLAGAMRDHADGFARRSGLRVDLELPPDLVRLPRETELALFRVLQEALANIQRHSGSKTASIRVAQTADGIRLEVRDQGRGMVRRSVPVPEAFPAGTLGMGILGMRERMRQLGGGLEIQSDGHGTAVIATVPRNQETRRA